MSFLFSGLISIMSTDRGTIISPHISPTLSIDTDSKKSVINLVQNFPKARALPPPRPACVLWKWLSKSVIVNCVIACTAACTVACIGMIGDWSLTNANHHKTAARHQTDAFKLSSRKNEIFPHRRQPIQWWAAFCCLARHSGGRSQTMMEFCTPVSGQFKILNRILFV